MNKYKDIALSNNDIEKKLKMFNINCQIVPYNELYKYKSIDELLYPSDSVIILYMWKPFYGHWCCLTKRHNNVEFFNSYGGYVDYPILNNIDNKFRLESNQDYPYLTNLLLLSPYNLHYNEFQFQKKKSNIKTCGRHSLMRVLLKNFDIYEYKKILDIVKKKYMLKDYDDVVTFLTA